MSQWAVEKVLTRRMADAVEERYKLARRALCLGSRLVALVRFLPGPERLRAECTM